MAFTQVLHVYLDVLLIMQSLTSLGHLTVFISFKTCYFRVSQCKFIESHCLPILLYVTKAVNLFRTDVCKLDNSLNLAIIKCFGVNSYEYEYANVIAHMLNIVICQSCQF